MNESAKKTLLQMIPDALYVLTSQAGGKTAASTITWLSQASFKPPLVMTALKLDSHTYQVVHQARGFVLNYLGEGQKDLAQKFFKHVEPEGEKLAGETFTSSPVLGFPVFPNMAGFLECKVVDIVERGDHSVVVAEVIEAGMGSTPGPLLLSSTGWKYGG
jgi:flavin reductase (DIM6/NTAB) family NADH-FMN oxidoreductase RutF